MGRGFVAALAIAIAAVAPAGAPTQIVAPVSPYPQCQANHASTSACACGIRPAAICAAGSWCSFTPEGAPLCSRRRPLH